MKYYLKYKKKIVLEKEKSKKDLYYEALRKSKLSFYFSLLNNKPMSKLELLSKWYRLANANKEIKTTKDILFSNTHTKINEKGNVGYFIEKLSNFYDSHEKEKFAIILVNSYLPVIIDGKYELNIPIDLVKETRIAGRKRPALELYHEIDDHEVVTEYSIENDMYISLVAHAFRNTFGYTETHIKVEQPRWNRAKRTTRNKEQIDEAISNVSTVLNNIENGNFYKIIGHKCNECPYKEVCSRTKLS